METKTFQRIKPIDKGGSPVLPLVYDDSLSYYEAIQKCMARINLISDLINSFSVNEAFIEQSKAYTDRELAQAKADFNEIINNLRGQLQAMADKEAADIASVEAQLSEAVAEFRSSLLRVMMIVKDIPVTIDSQIEIVKSELMEYIKEYMGDVDELMVTSPPTGKRVPVQVALYDLYDVIVGFWSLTAAEYDSLELTASQYDKLQLTAYQYDNLARWYLWDLFKNRMISPFTGKMDSYENIINRLADFHKQALTAGEYDALGLTAGGYDSKRLTAYEYDWFGKTLLGGGASG